MKTLFKVVSASAFLLVSGLATAQEPVNLTAQQMDNVSAGGGLVASIAFSKAEAKYGIYNETYTTAWTKASQCGYCQKSESGTSGAAYSIGGKASSFSAAGSIAVK